MYRRLNQWFEARTDVGLLVLRVFVGLVFINHGLGKVMDLPKFIEGVGKMFPMPQVLGPFAAGSEFLGGLLLALGLFTRPAAACIFVTMANAALVVHASDPFQKKELAFAYAAAALMFLFAGPGKYSVDAAMAKKK